MRSLSAAAQASAAIAQCEELQAKLAAEELLKQKNSHGMKQFSKRNEVRL